MAKTNQTSFNEFISKQRERTERCAAFIGRYQEQEENTRRSMTVLVGGVGGETKIG